MSRIRGVHGAAVLLASIAAATASDSARAQIYGTMSNFDTYNTTPEPCEGAEIELEGVRSSSLYSTFPAHFANKIVTEYDDGVRFGVRIRYEDYNFNPSVTMGSLQPNPNPVSTNGHQLTYTDGGEHFGFAISSQPTAARFYWLNRLSSGEYVRINPEPVAIPSPTWTYVPPAGGGAPQIEARAEIPENEFEVQKPDAVWMKVYKSEELRNVELDELMSGDEPGNIVPQDEAEIETEWELLEGGRLAGHGGKLDDQDSKSMILRYELFKYLGPVDDENEPTSVFTNGDLDAPPEGELGDFIAANMVAANLDPLNLNWGDYNDDSSVDGADIMQWQRQHGNRGEHAADGNHDERVDDDDLRMWESHFGDDLAPIAAGAAAAVPEPTTLALGAALLLAAQARLRAGSARRGRLDH